MLLNAIRAAALLCPAAALAFQGTSPLFISSPQDITSRPLSRSLIVSGSEASSELLESLDSCTSDNYVIVSQPGVSPADFTSPRAALNLQRLLHGGNHSYTIPDVVGAVDTEAIVKRLVDVCKETEATTIDATTGKVPEMSRVIHISFPTPSEAAGSERMSQLSQHDSFLQAVLNELPSVWRTTFIYTTTSRPEDITLPPMPTIPKDSEHSQYEMDDAFGDSLRLELRRNVEIRADNATHNLPLFETYQYFSPGIFMGLLTLFFLFPLMYVGISAIAGLEVSYFAFSKEMGPAQQKKQQ